MLPTIHFSHANGFPAGSYTTLLSYLESEYQINSIECIGHNARYPVSNNWTYLADELIHECETRYQKPVILMGHSLGAVLSCMVTLKRPDLVAALVMLDAPVPTSIQKIALKLSKRLGFVDYITPAARTQNRCTHWSSKDEAYHYFEGKHLMQKFDARCLHDYVEYGTQKAQDGGVELCFKHDVEMAIYRSLPDNINQNQKLHCPAAIFAGSKSNVFWQANGRIMQKMGMHLDWVDSGHMFPLEQPELTATKIKQFLAQHV